MEAAGKSYELMMESFHELDYNLQQIRKSNYRGHINDK